jgi:hypothetical protein
MKRMIILCLALVLVQVSAFADQAVLIDFSQLGEEGGQTEIDFANQAGSGFTAEEKALMKTSLFIENWSVRLNSSARSVQNQSLTYPKAVTVKADASQNGGATIMGFRVHFPETPYNAYAEILPPFEIPAYYQDEQFPQGDKFDGYGVVKNVGVLKAVAVEVYGRNFPNGLEIVLVDQTNKEMRLFIGNLEFDGWKTLVWENPNYITEVRNRELKKFALYPRLAPMVRLDSIVVYKDGQQEGGDFIGYIKDIEIIFDKAVLELESDVEEEAIWGILSEREAERRKREFQRLGNDQVLRYLEEQKLATEDPDEAFGGDSE